MAGRPRRRSRASGQGNPGTRLGEAVSRPEDGNHHVLRRRIPVGADGGRGGKDGLSQRPLAHRRLQRHGGGGLADEKRRTVTGWPTMKTTRLKCLMPGVDLDTVRSSAFRRFGWAPVLGRLKAELQTKLHVCVVSVRSGQSRSFALPVLVALSFVVVSVLHA